MMAARPAENSKTRCGNSADGTKAAIANAPNTARPWPIATTRFEPASCSLVDGSFRPETIRNSGVNAQTMTAQKNTPYGQE